MSFSLIDIALLGVLLSSAILGLMRGLIREVMAILGWIVAFWSARTFHDPIGGLLPIGTPDHPMRTIAAFILVLFAVRIAMGLGARILAGAFHLVGLGFLDRLFGLLFGLARATLVITVCVMLAGLTRYPAEPAWQRAQFIEPFELFALSLKPWLPENLASRMRFPQFNRHGLKVMPEDGETLPFSPNPPRADGTKRF